MTTTLFVLVIAACLVVAFLSGYSLGGRAMKRRVLWIIDRERRLERCRRAASHPDMNVSLRDIEFDGGEEWKGERSKPIPPHRHDVREGRGVKLDPLDVDNFTGYAP